MPVPFEHSPPDRQPEVIGWFHCRADSQGCAAALFQTTPEGIPLGICFSRADRAVWPDGSDAELMFQVRLDCVRAVLRSAVPSPTVLIGFESEVAAGIEAGGLEVGLPLASVTRNAARATYAWAAAGRPTRQLADIAASRSEVSSERSLLAAVMAQHDSLEPLDRVANALRELASDRALCESTLGLGVAVAVDLSVDHKSRGHTRSRGTASRGQPPFAQRLRELLAAPIQTECSDLELDWPGELLPFQLKGVQALVGSDRLLLADDMGLGKTLQAIAALRVLLLRKAVRASLIVAPASLLEQWCREIRKWAPEVRAIIVRGAASERSWRWAAEAEVFLASYDTLRSEFDSDPRSEVWRRTWGVVIADEAQRIKNRNQTSGALKRLRRERSWALTGTPLENRADDLASIMEFVDHDSSGEPRRYWPGNELAARHRHLQLRRKKGDVLPELPAKLTTKVCVELHPDQYESYSKAEREGIVYLEKLGKEVRVHHLIALLTRLKQICNADPKTGKSAKLDDIENRLAELTSQGHKALVFSQYVDETFGVAAAVRRLQRFVPLSITGLTPQEERSEVIDSFKRESARKVLVLSLRVGGLGLNLQEASYVFYMDRWWNPATERQSEDRSHRIGQSQRVTVFKYSCVGTIEERIDEILESKQRLFDEMVDDVSLDLGARLSRKDLYGLFRLAGAPESG